MRQAGISEAQTPWQLQWKNSDFLFFLGWEIMQIMFGVNLIIRDWGHFQLTEK